ncbi:alpha/beta fold hydrolase [Phenylobacterium sp.]|jgi:alpha-beta hydrolase superfamily lysophospholipase|uniref:alpha/beta fold hydrolase n=1 Tax=Phenylobacterium sp. TaxID=1871053 RepID=UPI002F9310E9
MTIRSTTFRYHGADGTALAGFRWDAAGEDRPAPRAVLQLAHGAGEHSGRYREPLGPLAAAGFRIYAADHRGHGLTSGMSHLGDFGPGGAPAAVDDMAVLSRLARDENPGLPLVLMGHSMGAMFAQAYLLEHSGLIDALVLSGTAGPGPRMKGGPNSVYANPRTPYDWLSRDPAEVDRYIADPFCGIRFSEASAASFASLRERELTPQALAGVRRGLPVYVFVGDEDPINEKLVRLTPLVDAYRAAGLDVTLKVYRGGRHEMLNETNRAEVVADLLAWLQQTVG